MSARLKENVAKQAQVRAFLLGEGVTLGAGVRPQPERRCRRGWDFTA